MERAECLPFCRATQGLTSRQGLTLRFPLALEHGKVSPTPAKEAPCVARENSFSSHTNARVARGLSTAENFRELHGSKNGAFQMESKASTIMPPFPWAQAAYISVVFNKSNETQSTHCFPPLINFSRQGVLHLVNGLTKESPS